MNNDKRKRNIKILVALGVLVFVCGGIARTINQKTGIMWLDGIVGIMMGLYAFFVDAALIYHIFTIPRDTPSGYRFYIALAIPLALCALFFLFGLLMIYLGTSRFVSSLP